VSSVVDMFGGDLPERVHAKQLLIIFDISSARLAQYRAKGLIRDASNDTYNLAETVQWMVRYWREKKANSDDVLMTTRIRKTKADAEKSEMDNDVKRGKLVERDQIAHTLETVTAILVSSLDSLAPRMANELSVIDDPQTITGIINAETRAIRNNIADRLQDYCDDTSDSGADKT